MRIIPAPSIEDSCLGLCVNFSGVNLAKPLVVRKGVGSENMVRYSVGLRSIGWGNVLILFLLG